MLSGDGSNDKEFGNDDSDIVIDIECCLLLYYVIYIFFLNV